MEYTAHQIKQARLLVARLERISADSIWARRASGMRGALLKWLEEFEQASLLTEVSPSYNDHEKEGIDLLIEMSYKMLEKAAKERLR
jgi:hypothetical protein